MRIYSECEINKIIELIELYNSSKIAFHKTDIEKLINGLIDGDINIREST